MLTQRDEVIIRGNGQFRFLAIYQNRATGPGDEDSLSLGSVFLDTLRDRDVNSDTIGVIGLSFRSKFDFTNAVFVRVFDFDFNAMDRQSAGLCVLEEVIIPCQQRDI